MAENEADAGTSFAAVERSMSDRLLESTNSNEPNDRDARQRSMDLGLILSTSGTGNRGNSCDPAQGYRFGMT